MTLKELAIEACKKHSVIAEAVDYVWRKLKADEKLMRELLQPMLQRAVQEAIYDRRHANLRTVKQNASCRTLESLQSTSEVWKQTLIDTWIMPDGRALGDWTGEELTVEAVAERKKARGLTERASLFESLGRKAGKATVRSKVSAAEVEKMWQRITGKSQNAVA